MPKTVAVQGKRSPRGKARPKEPRLSTLVMLLMLAIVVVWLLYRGGEMTVADDSFEAKLDWARKNGKEWTQGATQEDLARWGEKTRWVEGKRFPLPAGSYTWGGGFGDPREDGARLHEGVDLMCQTGTPIHSVGDGTVEQMGWLPLGGWRIGIRGADGVYYYYAHMSNYAAGLEVGGRIVQNQVIGYAGDTGRGPEGTTGMMAPHLHYGMYIMEGGEEKAIDPQAYLRYIEYEEGRRR